VTDNSSMIVMIVIKKTIDRSSIQ